MTLKIVFLDRDTLSPSTALRTPDFAHEWVQYPRTRPDQVAERVRDADIVIVNKVPLRAEVLAQAPRLKLIAVAATGTDNIDLLADQLESGGSKAHLFHGSASFSINISARLSPESAKSVVMGMGAKTPAFSG